MLSTHTYRAPDELYRRALRVARQRGDTLADVIRRALTDYVEPRPTPTRNPGRRVDDGQPANGQARRR